MLNYVRECMRKHSKMRTVVHRLLLEFKPYGFCGSFIVFPIKRFVRLHIYCPPELKKIQLLKNAEEGKRCFILSTGPSLSREDIALLKNEVTIGMNTIYKMFSELSWKPTYYVMTDPKLYELLENKEHIDVREYSEKYSIVNYLNKKNVKYEDKVIYVINCWLDHVYHFGKSKKFKYSEKPQGGVYDYYSVTQECIYYAMYAGCKEIYLLGADNNYVGDKQHFVDVSGIDPISYDHALDIQNGNDYGYEYLNKIANSKGIKIYNATRGGRVEIFPRVKLEEVLNNK